MFTGVFNAQGVAVHAWSAYDGTPGGDSFPVLTGPIGLYAAAAHSTGIAAVLDHRATGGGKLLSGRNDGTEVITMTTAGNITATGTVTANAFSGDGSGLSNVTGVGSLASDPAACSVNNFVTDIAADGTLTCAQPSSSNLSDAANLAPSSPQYVTLATNATLTNERVLSAGKGIAITDGGAGSAVTIDNKVEFAQTTIQGGDTVTNFPVGGSEFATTYTIPANTLTAGMVIEVWAAGLQVASTTGNSFGYGVKLGSTIAVPGNVGLFSAATANSLPWTLNARIICTDVSGGTATLEAQGSQISPSSATAFGTRNNFNTATFTVDATVTQELKIYQGINANDGINDTATLRQLIVKILK
jgi:hypothetical protein